VRDVVLLLTQEELAEKMGVKRGSVGNWELSDDNGISRKNLAALAELAGCSMGWIETGAGQAPVERARDALAENRKTAAASIKLDDEACFSAVVQGVIAGFGVTGYRATELERLVRKVLAEQLDGHNPEEDQAARRALAQFVTREFLRSNKLLDE